MQNESNRNEADVWEQIAPLLDTAMAGLNETDRHAVVLRFFDGKSMMEISAARGANEFPAGNRVAGRWTSCRNTSPRAASIRRPTPSPGRFQPIPSRPHRPCWRNLQRPPRWQI